LRFCEIQLRIDEPVFSRRLQGEMAIEQHHATSIL
jgi:hypothetical protein